MIGYRKWRGGRGWVAFALGCGWGWFSANGAGVTLITHGYQGNVTEWVIPMCNRVPSHPGFPGTSYTIYQLSITRFSGGVYNTTVTSLGGVSPLASDSGEIIIALDWSTLSDLGGASTSVVATQAVNGLMSTSLIPALGGRRLAELPLHLIGHSRGASVVAEMARVLGASGLWVDHQTTHDPYPVGLLGDPSMKNYANVLYADNYWQSTVFPTGQAVSGAYNRFLPALSGGNASNHSDTHLWYHGTVDLNTPTQDNLASITSAERAAWWTAVEQAGTNAGFHYSLIGGGARLSNLEPAGAGNGRINDGFNRVWELGAGTNPNRSSLPVDSGAWPNLIRLNLAGASVVAAGQPVPVSLYYQLGATPAATGSLSLFLDSDANPYSGNETQIQSGTLSGTGTNAVGMVTVNGVTDAATTVPGTYRVFGRLSDGGRTRYLYAPQVITLTPSVQRPLLLSPALQGGQFRFTLAGTLGQRIVTLTSSDFQSWTPVATNVMLGSSTNIALPASFSSPPHFYRAVLAP